MTDQVVGMRSEWTYFQRKPAFLWDPNEDSTEPVVVPDQMGTRWRDDAETRFPVIRGGATLLAELIMDRSEYDQWLDGTGECHVVESTAINTDEGMVVGIESRDEMSGELKEFVVYAASQGSMHAHRYGFALTKQIRQIATLSSSMLLALASH